MPRRSKWGMSLVLGSLWLAQIAEGIALHKWISYDCADQECCYEEPNCNNDLKRGEDAIRCISNLASDCFVEIWSYVEVGPDDMCQNNERHIGVDASPLIGHEIISMRGSFFNHNERPQIEQDRNLVLPDSYWLDDATALWSFQQPTWNASMECGNDTTVLPQYNFDRARIVYGGNRTQQIFTWLDFRIPNESQLIQINENNTFWTFSITARSVLDAKMMEAYNNTKSWDRWPLTENPEIEVDAPREFSLVPISTTTSAPDSSIASSSASSFATSDGTGTVETTTPDVTTTTTKEATTTSSVIEGTPREFVFPTYPVDWVEPSKLVNGFPETQFRWNHANLLDPRIGLFVKKSFKGQREASQKADSAEGARRKLYGPASSVIVTSGPVIHFSFLRLITATLVLAGVLSLVAAFCSRFQQSHSRIEDIQVDNNSCSKDEGGKREARRRHGVKFQKS